MKRVLIIADEVLVREGVKRIIESQSGGAVFGEASAAPEALRLVREDEWDIAVLDLDLGGQRGLCVLKELKPIRPGLPVLVVSIHSETQYAHSAFKAGAAGYVTKDRPRAELLRAMNAVIEGGRYFSASLAEMSGTGVKESTGSPLHKALSKRELEVLYWIGAGKTVSEIARLLSVSDKSISTYRVRVLKKMAMKNTAELMRYAILNKLMD